LFNADMHPLLFYGVLFHLSEILSDATAAIGSYAGVRLLSVSCSELHEARTRRG